MNNALIVRCFALLFLTFAGVAGADPTTGTGGGVGAPTPGSLCCTK